MRVSPAIIRCVACLTLLLAIVFEYGGNAARSNNETTPADPMTVYRQAGVTPEQEAKIKLLAGQYENSARVRLQRIRNLSGQLRQLSYEPDLDEEKILALQDEINLIHAGLSTDRIKLMLNIRQLLNQEQRQKLVQLMKESAAGTITSNAQ